MLTAGCQWQQEKTTHVDSMFFPQTESQKNIFSERSEQLRLTVNHCLAHPTTFLCLEKQEGWSCIGLKDGSELHREGSENKLQLKCNK